MKPEPTLPKVPESDAEPWMNSTDAAKYLGVDKSTLLRSIHRGDIVPSGRLPRGGWRFRRSDLDRTLKY